MEAMGACFDFTAAFVLIHAKVFPRHVQTIPSFEQCCPDHDPDL